MIFLEIRNWLSFSRLLSGDRTIGSASNPKNRDKRPILKIFFERFHYFYKNRNRKILFNFVWIKRPVNFTHLRVKMSAKRVRKKMKFGFENCINPRKYFFFFSGRGGWGSYKFAPLHTVRVFRSNYSILEMPLDYVRNEIPKCDNVWNYTPFLI